ncbi:immunoglobulin-like domain-containing protein [Enterococcus mundtii]|uniref:immunoglobulin-like domain-containing protein n=1 Tax=Enterococcus mundtii TaxID=53346 RepID=UPI003004052A
MKQKKQPLSNKKSLLIFASSALIGIGTVGLLGNSLTSTENTRPADTKKQLPEEKETTESSNPTPNLKEETKDKAAGVFDRFDIDLPLGGLFTTDPQRASNSAVLQPQELRSIASAVRERDTQASVTPTPQAPALPVVPDLPDEPLLPLPTPGEEDEPVVQPPTIVDPPVIDPPVPPIVQETTPSISLFAQTVYLNQGDSFSPYDYFSVMDSGDSAPIIEISPYTLSVGTHTISIRATNRFGNSASANLIVVVNSRPVLTPAATEIDLEIHDKIDLLDYIQADDLEDGDITDSVRVSTNLDMTKEGSYEATYRVRDSSGASARPVTITFHVNNEAPVIHTQDIEWEIDQLFNPLDFVKVTDREDDRDGLTIEVTEEHILENDVDISKEGTYTVRFGGISDRDGKLAEERTMTVTVVNEAPHIYVPDMIIEVGSAVDQDRFINSIVVSDREDDKKGLLPTIEVDHAALNAVDSSSEGEFLIPISATDSHGKRSEAIGKIIVVASQEQEPPAEEVATAEEVKVVNEPFLTESSAIPSEIFELPESSDSHIEVDSTPSELSVENVEEPSPTITTESEQTNENSVYDET